jgi:copper oxidase (laccase) domain-containing protein
MSEYQIQIGDEVRDMTAEEIAQRDKDVAEMKAQEKARADKAKLKADTLAKLGLTADEVAALLS